MLFVLYERILFMQKSKDDNTDSPQIELKIINFFSCMPLRTIVDFGTNLLFTRVRLIGNKSKIDDLESEIRSEHNVLKLEVSMREPLGMQFSNTI